MEQIIMLVPVKIFYQCEECKEGEMIYFNDRHYMLPARLEKKHKCSTCGFEKSLNSIYPKFALQDGNGNIVAELEAHPAKVSNKQHIVDNIKEPGDMKIYL